MAKKQTKQGSSQEDVPAKSEDQETLEKLEKFYEASISDPAHVDWRDKIAIPCFKYKENEQYSSSELTELDKRKQPPTIHNHVKITIDRLVGQFIKLKTRIGFKPRNIPQDEGIAKGLSDLFLFIKQNNQMEFEERDMVEDGVTCGFGALEAYVEYDDNLKPQIKIRHEDALHVFYDNRSRRYDWNEDALYVGRWRWVELDEAKELYPNKKKELVGLMSDTAGIQNSGIEALTKENQLFDKERKRVRLVEIQYKTKKKISTYLFSDGAVLDEADAASKIEEAKKTGLPYKAVDRLKTTIYLGVFTEGILLEHKETGRKHFSLVPYFVQRKKSGAPYSMIFTALTLQDEINKRASKALHLLNTNQAVYEAGAVTNKNELATEMALPDGQIEVNAGFLQQNKFEIMRNLELAQTQMQFHEAAVQDYRMVTGVNPDALGEPSEIRSGVGIAKKIAMTEMVIASVFDNLRRTRVILAKNVVELIQLYFDEDQMFQITDSMNVTRDVMLSKDNMASVKQSTYDVVVDEIPDLATNQEEQFRLMMELLPQILPLGPFWIKFLLKMSPMRDKEDLIKMLDSVPPPDNKPKISISAQIDMLTPMERVFLYQEMGAPDEVIQSVLQSNIPPTNVLKAQAEQARNQSKVQSDMIKVAGDRAKVQGEMEKARLDMVARREGTQLDIASKKMDLQKKQLEIQQTIIKGSQPKGEQRDSRPV